MQACVIDFGYHFIARLGFITPFIIAQCWNYPKKGKLCLTLEVAGDIILNLIMA